MKITWNINTFSLGNIYNTTRLGEVFPGDSVVKNHLPMQETQVQSPGQEDPLEKEMATHSSILAWRIPRTEELGGLQSMGSQKSWTQFND